jgi:hypothetical protein
VRVELIVPIRTLWFAVQECHSKETLTRRHRASHIGLLRK